MVNRARTMAYEIYYALTTTTTCFEKLCFLVWFFLDASFATIAVNFAYAPDRRPVLVKRLVVGVLLGIVFLHSLCQWFPDEREQVTANRHYLAIANWMGLFVLATVKRRYKETESQDLVYSLLIPRSSNI